MNLRSTLMSNSNTGPKPTQFQAELGSLNKQKKFNLARTDLFMSKRLCNKFCFVDFGFKMTQILCSGFEAVFFQMFYWKQHGS